MDINLTRLVFSPSPMATSSPKLKIVILGDIIMAPINAIPPIKDNKITPSHLALTNPPDTQKLNC